MARLDGKVAIVTGGGRGLGRGIAMALAHAGARLSICGRTGPPLDDVVTEIETLGGEALSTICDIAEEDDRERLIAATLDRFGRIDILVNNAAVIPHGTLLDIDPARIDAAWRAGPLAALHLMRLCHPHLKGGGAIVNVSGGIAIANNVPMRGIYAATKAALNAISRSAANEWGVDGIRVNTIMPLAHTAAFAAFIQSEPELSASVLAGVPLGHAGDPEADIGPAVVFLAGPDAHYITGVTLPIDGGTAYIR